jgi:hypothetical protein
MQAIEFTRPREQYGTNPVMDGALTCGIQL